MDTNGNGKYTIKEMLDKIIIPKLDKMAEDVAILKEQTPLRIYLIEEFQDLKNEVTRLSKWKWKLTGAFGFIGSGTVAAIAKLFFLG